MNKQNAIRHILKKCRKAKTYEQFCEIAKLLNGNGLTDIWRNKCDECECDDFGYCTVNDEVYDNYAEMEFCLPALIEKLEKELPKRSDNNGE